MLSQYCKECIEYTAERCQGKEGGVITSTYFGRIIREMPSFLNFCKRYQFDIELWRPDQSDVFVDEQISALHNKRTSAKKVKQQRKVAKKQRVAKAESIASVTEVEIGEQLSSSDFEDLLL